MKVILQVILVTDAIFLVTLIMMQNRGTNMGGAFGGDTSVNYQRRGGEKVLHYITILLALIFVGTSFAALFVY